MNIRSLPAGPGAVLLAALLLVSTCPASDQEPVAPDWELRCADGSRIGMHEALGNGPVLVSFWALWCLPCLKELPHLDELAKQTEDRLTVLAVNMDSSKSVSKVRPYLRSKGYELIVPLDTSGNVGRLLHVGHMLPFAVLYDGDGREVWRHVGYRDGDEIELRRQVAVLLGDEQPEKAEAEPSGSAE